VARTNVPLLALNRGLVSPKALARVDLDRTRLSAEVQTNWLSNTQGALSLRPGTKYMGSVACDTGAELIEFVASTDDVALLELTHDTGSGQGRMRVWLGDDAHNLQLMKRPHVDTHVSLSDTGWEDASLGGSITVSGFDLIPTMVDQTTSGVSMTASSTVDDESSAWSAGDDDVDSLWVSDDDPPQWLKVDLGSAQQVSRYSIRAVSIPEGIGATPSAWTFQGNHSDTGSAGSWTTLDTVSGQSSWAVGQKRTFNIGSPQQFRFYRWNITANAGGYPVVAIAEVELIGQASGSSDQGTFNHGNLILNAVALGSVARVRKRVIVDTGDLGSEHQLSIDVSHGPVTFRIGSSAGDDDYVSEAMLATGHHYLAFTPTNDFHITIQNDKIVNRIIDGISIADSGVTAIPTPWSADDLDDIRYDQSADVVYVDCRGVKPHKIERRGVGRSWSVVEYDPNDGPLLTAPSSSAKLKPNGYYGNIKILSDVPFFQSGHVGALIRMFHSGQSGVWPLGNLDTTTDPIEVTGIGDTGTDNDIDNERRIIFDVSGSWSGEITIERSFDGPEFGFRPIVPNLGTPIDTGTFTTTIDDPDDNISAWYRAKITSYTSGVAVVRVSYKGGGTTGIARITGYNSNQEVDAEVLSRFSDTGPTDNWQEGWWSDRRGYPTAVSLHGGRLWHAGGATVFGSVSDDYESFDESVEGDAGPIVKTLGSGPVDSVHYIVSLLRLIIGTAGAEIAVRSSSLDEPLTPTNSNAIAFSTQGSAPLRGLKMDTRCIMVQRSRQRVFMLGAGVQGASFGDYEGLELTLLVPDLLNARVKSVAIQRQPDTRIHFALEDGKVAILTYEPTEEVICWYLWETDGTVERVAVLPGIEEDAVFYLIRREINGQTKRFIEKWAKESECVGDTGLTWLMDAAVSYTDTGRTNVISGLDHLVGEEVIVWSDDTGSIPGVDRSPDIDGLQRTYTVDTGGSITLDADVHHAVVGLPYSATWKSTKLAYAAQAGTALNQAKRVPQMGMILHQTHARALQYGSDTGGPLDSLPKMYRGKALDPDHIFRSYDEVAISFPSGWDTDARVVIKAKAPRPATIMALVPSIQTNERV